MKGRKGIGFVLLFAVSWAIMDITGASPANFIISKGFSATADTSLMPFADILSVCSTGNLLSILVNIGGNVALFLPLGFLLPMVWTGFRRLPRAAAFGACVSLLIEVSQLFNYRATVTDDLLLNTCGAVLGYLCAVAVLRLFPKLSPDDFGEQHCILPAALAVLIPYAVQTAQEVWFYLTQW